MKKLLTLLSLLIVAISTFGQTFTIGDLTYAVLSEEEKTAQVVNGHNATGDVVVPETVIHEETEYRVTRVGDFAFRGTSITHMELPGIKEIGNWALAEMKELKYLSIPKLEKIGKSVFVNGTEIDVLRIGSVEQYCNIQHEEEDRFFNSHYFCSLFIGDSEIPATEITIPESVQRIPEYAFWGINIHTIHFEGITPPTLASTNSVSYWAMLSVPDDAYDTYLNTDVYKTIPLRITTESSISKNVEMEADGTTSRLLTKLGGDEVARKVVNLTIKGTINSYDMMIIRNRMTSLRNLDLTEASIVDCDYEYSSGHHSIKDVITADWLRSLMNVKLPSSATTIDNNAFYQCGKLVSVVIPEGVTSIGSDAFYQCGITDISLPQSLTSIGSSAFEYCEGLKTINIPEGVTSIGNYAFNRCSRLKEITIPASIEFIGSRAFFITEPLSLRIIDLDKWYGLRIGSYAFRNIDKLYVGDSDIPVESITIPSTITELNNNIFGGFKCIKNFIIPSELRKIGDGTFIDCSFSTINLPKSLNTIGNNAFSGCTELSEIELPPYLESIGSGAFDGCSSITKVLIPASVKEIGDDAFGGCNNLNTVIATTVEPITINQNTFSTYRTADVYSPKTSYWKYYWNTQWNQFLSVKEYDKEFAEVYGYKYFYLNGKNGDNFEDFVIDDETGTLHGANHYEQFPPIEKAPDADFNEGAGMIVGGEQIQELGDIHIHHNGNNGASVIAKAEGKVHIDNLYVDIKTQKNRWYFFCFPFDINPGEATFDGSHVWYLYDGEARAKNGNGGWKKLANDGVMKMGNGYIFQGAVNGTLTIHVSDLTIDASDKNTNLITYQSDNKNDASWNLVGNSNMAYYGINDLMLNDIPVTVYNNETGNYEAVRPGDDDYEFYPFQAFFVQKPEGVETLTLAADKQDTKNKVDLKKAARLAKQANGPKRIDAMRKIINLELASVGMAEDSVAVATDRTRIVVNPTKSVGYETECDAAKFIADNMPQIYSLDNEGCTYAINERPAENGIINIAVKTLAEGFYTITASRLDCDAKLLDLETGIEADLTKGGYTFAAEAATYTQRFQLILEGGTTGVKTVEDAKNAIVVEAGAISVNDVNADVRVYTIGGVLIASQKGAGSINVAPGTYVVNINGQSVKVTVNE